MSESNSVKYYTMLNYIEEQLPFVEIEKAESFLDDMFLMKPVRLKWYLVKAQLMLKKGEEVGSVIAFLRDKCDPCYEYEGVEEFLALMSMLYELNGDMLESQRYQYQLLRLKNADEQISAEEMREKRQSMLIGMDDFLTLPKEQIELQANDYFVRGEIYLYLLWMVLAVKLYGNTSIREAVLEKCNAGYYYDRLMSDSQECFVIMVTSQLDEVDCILAAKVLKAIGKQVFLIENPTVLEEKDVIEEKCEKIFSRITNKAGVYYLGAGWSSEYVCADTRGRTLQWISEKYATDGVIIVLATGGLVERLVANKDNIPKFERLTACDADYMEDNIAIARYGDYLAYVANIYNTTFEQMKKLLYKAPKCRFSIIIPCRNAGETLYYTLKTCLNQTYQGSYEIVISDNSSMALGEITPTFEICKQFNDQRIKYIRTPRELSLMKNFEFAYLHAEGEFLLSMGADDGILPWALEELAGVLDKYPDSPIWLWHEVFYKWAEVNEEIMNDSGHALLRVGSEYKKGSPDLYDYSTKTIFERAISNYGSMYYLPQLYHNSGIYRYYLSRLYERTGLLWAGISQDMCMAVTIGSIEERLSFIDNTLTITGISNASIGANCRVGNNPVIEKRMKKTYAQGWRVSTDVEHLFPPMGGEMGGLYACILYAYAIGVISDDVIDAFDWKEMYMRVVNEISRDDGLYDKKIHKLRYAISMHGEEMLKWFDETIYDVIMEPSVFKREAPEAVGDVDIVEIMGQKHEVAKTIISDVYRVALFLEEYWKK